MTHNAFELARLADVASPDSLESPGAEWLAKVARFADDDDVRYDEDSIGQAADEAVPVYTHDRWQVFVDLAAYSEDLTDLGDEFGGAEDLTTAAGVALYLIAERLLNVLVQERDDDAEQDEED